MGYALAEAARDRGWEVDLVSGPVALPPPAGIRLHRVVSAEEMFRATERLFAESDILIMCAAVADYRPVRTSREKVKKGNEPWVIEMEPTVDIARTLGAAKGKRRLVGFAAETENLEAYAEKKLMAKHMDWIVANRVGGSRCAMEGDENEILMISEAGDKRRFGPAVKSEVARFILDTLQKGRA
jgi:phosphopantothenoylcysteine decarboxylase/phosphopantothenate--cysteine ligase